MTTLQFHRLIRSARKAGVSTIPQIEVLATIAMQDDATHLSDKALAARCGLSRTGAAHITRRLHALEFIDRHVTQSKLDDARISLSPLGRAWFESIGISCPVISRP
jgi:DNA-binding MarR family transcriptional regulator